jgi:hypothetical protein
MNKNEEIKETKNPGQEIIGSDALKSLPDTLKSSISKSLTP